MCIRDSDNGRRNIRAEDGRGYLPVAHGPIEGLRHGPRNGQCLSLGSGRVIQIINSGRNSVARTETDVGERGSTAVAKASLKEALSGFASCINPQFPLKNAGWHGEGKAI